MDIIQKRGRREEISYRKEYRFMDGTSSGFSFICDENGVLLPDTNSCATKNHDSCQTGIVDGHPVKYEGIRKHVDSWTEPAIGVCWCKTEVVLDRFTNTCDNCNRDYNMSGDLLAHRSQWGEETGESLADILQIH